MRAVAFPAPPAARHGLLGASDVSVVVITRNRPGWLRRCLVSLAGQTHPAGEVIVVDSSDGAGSERVAAGLPGIRYIRFPGGRRSMPAARNAGVRLAIGEVVAFLDDDCEASPGWLAALAQAYRDSQVGGAGGKVLDPVVILGPVRRFLDSGEPWAEPDRGELEPADVDFLQGGNMSFRREALLSSGGFDPRYTGTNYREETDLCFRLRRLGRRLVYVPGAVVAHRRAPRADGVGRSPEDPRREFFHARNQTYFVVKNYGLDPRPLAFYLGRQTLHRTLTLVRHPSARRLAWWAAHLGGKIAGLGAALRHHVRRVGR